MSHGHEIHIHQENYLFKGKAKTLSLALLAIGILFTVIGIFTLPHTETHHAAPAVAESVAEHGAEHATEHAATAHEYPGQNINGVDVGHSDEQVYPVVSEHAKPASTRIFMNLLLNGYFVLLISVCGLFFFALQYIANAGWATVLLRVPQAMSTFLPVGAVILLLVFFIDGENIYHWLAYEKLHLTKGQPGFDKILDNKSWFLNSKMVVGFLVAIPLTWILFGMKLRSLSYKEDAEGGLTFFNKSIRFGAAFVLVFGFTLSILSWVVNMSVDAHWYSTIFSLYNFATGWVSTIAIIILFVLYLKRNGYLNLVTDEHIHDLGKFMFAFSVFWTYLWFAQFILIWYANIPEETVYYYKRWESPFKLHFFLNLILNFLIPFLVLMTRNNKRNPKILTVVAIIILIGHWNDLYLMLMPGAIDKQAGVGFLEVGMTLAFAGLFIYWVLTALSKKGLVPMNHPYLEESVHHDVGV